MVDENNQILFFFFISVYESFLIKYDSIIYPIRIETVTPYIKCRETPCTHVTFVTRGVFEGDDRSDQLPPSKNLF